MLRMNHPIRHLISQGGPRWISLPDTIPNDHRIRAREAAARAKAILERRQRDGHSVTDGADDYELVQLLGGLRAAIGYAYAAATDADTSTVVQGHAIADQRWRQLRWSDDRLRPADAVSQALAALASYDSLATDADRFEALVDAWLLVRRGELDWTQFAD
jgi:hypothetical protein